MNQEFARQLIGVAFFTVGALVMLLLWKIRGPIQASESTGRNVDDDNDFVFTDARPPVIIDATPDEPVAFGYKISWLAIRSTDANHVARMVGLTDLQPANWETGLEAAIRGEWIFVSPAIEGWVFVAGSDMPGPTAEESLVDWDRWMNAIAAEFSEVHYFGSKRDLGYCAWARFVDGRELRAFSCTVETIHVDRGTTASVERRWSANESKGDSRPGDEDVLRVAAEWGFNPMTLEDRDYPLGVGLVGRLR